MSVRSEHADNREKTVRKTQPGRNGGILKADAGPGRPPGSVSLLAELKRQLAEGPTLEKVIQATIIQAAKGNGTALKILWDRIDGPVKEQIEHSGSIDADRLTPEEREAEIRTILADIRAGS